MPGVDVWRKEGEKEARRKKTALQVLQKNKYNVTTQKYLWHVGLRYDSQPGSLSLSSRQVNYLYLEQHTMKLDGKRIIKLLKIFKKHGLSAMTSQRGNSRIQNKDDKAKE